MGYDLDKIPAQVPEFSSYQDYLNADRGHVPPHFREVGNANLDDYRITPERYTSRAFYERERIIWDKTWQAACREEHIPEAGDFYIYDVAKRSFIVARQDDGSVKAFANVCLHRGRKLRTEDGHTDQFRCPFHGFTWDKAGHLAHAPCAWDFPHLERENFNLYEAQVGQLMGWIWINPDPTAMPLEGYLDPLPRQFAPYRWDQSYLGLHAGKILHGNWKVIQEAFMESFHALDTHPQIMSTVDDFGCQYDIWQGKPHVNRMLVPFVAPSAYVADQVSQQEIYDDWTTGRPALEQDGGYRLKEGETARSVVADQNRALAEDMLGEKLTGVSDAELVDGWYYNVFPSLMHWGGYGPNMWYRFRPWQDSHEKTLMEVGFIMRHRADQPKPAPAPFILLDEETPWASVEGMEGLGFVLDQDTTNMRAVQEGLSATFAHTLTVSRYQEGRIRHWHQTLDRYLSEAIG